ncbi:D-alanyl-D-alanine carboxypeptidase [Reinekea sp. MED297]|uniref:D-alanyl-D-alanine carboxypeptidase n=2 Tax=Reinekea TaxID=230494 RepID=A4BA10_9GAMM|nr:D-alanyl-D-alanine carboxypeptidase [Reinekea sp. MED297] [Reinekea blandensis MED297]
MNEELGRAIDLGFDGIIVHVNQAGKTASYAAGWDDRKNLTPADPDALFKIASISKLYVAAATSILVAEGGLSLDTTLVDTLPDVAPRIEYASAITLRMLLQHRSGIPDFIDHPAFYDADIVENEDTYPYLLDQPAQFRPGNRYGYSNSNYFLIGEILDRALGYSHHRFIQDRILRPLGLVNTYSLLRDADLDDVMKGYVIGVDDGDVFWTWEHVQPSGSMVASAADVAKFLKALVDGTLLTPLEQAIYTSVYEYEHTGWLPGYTSIVRYHSDIDAVVVMFVNTSFNELFWLDLERTYRRIVRVLEKNPL